MKENFFLKHLHKKQMKLDVRLEVYMVGKRIHGFLGCCTMHCGGWILFQRTVLPPSSGLKCVVNGKWT
jgi:hypothetical protein